MHFIERRARALYRILDEMTLRIWDGELLVGTLGTNGRRSAPVFPEFSIEWMKDELDNLLETREQDTFEVPEQVKEDIRSIFPYWENKSIYQKYRKLLPEDTKKVRDAYVFSRDLFERNGYGHTAYQAEKIIKIGLKGLRAEVKAKYADLDLTKREDFDKKLFYDGLLICFDAITNYAKRYSDKALSMAKIESDPKRKAELFKIADVCSWVPENPARDIWEALQVVESVSYTHLDVYKRQGAVMVEQVYPAIIECDCLVMICPNYNDAVSANITAFINRLTAVFRTHDFSKKKIDVYKRQL